MPHRITRTRTGRSMAPRRLLQGLVLAMAGSLLVLPAGGGFAHGAPPGSGGPPPTVTAGKTVVGLVIEVDGEHCVIETELGERVSVGVDPTTFLPEPLDRGDKVEAVVLADGSARSIVKTR
jgi:hypothetical protein